MSGPKRSSSFWPSRWCNWGDFQSAHDRFAEYLQRSPDGKYARQSQFRVGETLYLDGQHAAGPRASGAICRSNIRDDALCAYVYPYLGEIALVAGESQEARERF